MESHRDDTIVKQIQAIIRIMDDNTSNLCEVSELNYAILSYFLSLSLSLIFFHILCLYICSFNINIIRV